jgi:membrane-associated phospholipid phosphatase
MLAARAAALALAVSVAVAPVPAAAGPHHALRYDLAVDLPLTIGAGAIWIGSELAKPHLATDECRWCEPPGIDRDARTLLVWSNPDPARITSDVLAFTAVPAAALVPLAFAADTRDDALLDALFVVEAVAIAADLNQLVKFAVGRERPFVHFGNYSDPDRPADADDQLSFYSGHTSMAFSFAAAAGTVANLRGYRSAPWVWGVGTVLASGVAYFRVAADRHYLTDVLTGAVIGAAVGVAVPRLLHPREPKDGGEAGAAQVTVVPLPIGLRVTF